MRLSKSRIHSLDRRRRDTLGRDTLRPSNQLLRIARRSWIDEGVVGEHERTTVDDDEHEERVISFFFCEADHFECKKMSSILIHFPLRSCGSGKSVSKRSTSSVPSEALNLKWLLRHCFSITCQARFVLVPRLDC